MKQLIISTLASGKQVQVFIAMPQQALAWNGLPVDTAAGLETGMIRMIQPEWNMQGVTSSLPPHWTPG